MPSEVRQQEFERAQQSRPRGCRGRGRGRGRTAATDAKAPGEASCTLPRQIRHGFNWGYRNVDNFMLDHVSGVLDVRGDGHCGYRSLSVVVGMGEDEFATMRVRLATHMIHNRALYDLGIHAVVSDFDQLVRNTSHVGRVTTVEQWMELPMVGLAFATEYQLPLVCVSYTTPFLCLPMTSAAPHHVPNVAGIGMANVGQRNHFVPVSSQVTSTCKIVSYFKTAP